MSICLYGYGDDYAAASFGYGSETTITVATIILRFNAFVRRRLAFEAHR